MKPELWIENDGKGKQIAGANTRVYLRHRDEHGHASDPIDISQLVRAVDVRLHVGEVVTARLEVFITGVKTRTEIEEVLVRELGVKRPWWRRAFDVTGFNRYGVKEYTWR